MRFVTVAGPFTEDAARETAKFLGNENHGVYSREINDPEGYGTGVFEWFVERNEDAIPARFCGLTWSEVQRKQRGN